MRSRKKKLVYFKKIPVRVDLEQWQRLDKIRADYHFKSTYEIMQYILGCFLRVADPMPGDDDEEVLPDEIKEMFYDLSQAERHFEYVKPKRKLPQHKVDEMNGQKLEKPCDFDPFGQTGLSPFGYNMIDPLKSWCWGSILFYPFKISRFS